MKWITELSIENYRAFTKKETIKIPFGNHLLIYGENGSGKSSVYNALKDFFISSDKPKEKLILNHFEKLNGNNSGSIEIEISDSSSPPHTTRYKYSEPDTESNHRRIQELLLANKAKGFIDYGRLLNTYFVNSVKGENPNLFDLLIEDLLADHPINQIPGTGVVDKELSKQWQGIKTPLVIEKYDGRTNKCKTAEVNLSKFQSELENVLKIVFDRLKLFIKKYFDDKLDIDVTISQLSFNTKSMDINRGIYLNIKYAGKEISSYQQFLNEARLSAIASCIYLSAMRPDSLDPSFEIRPLFLDDIFIGLDTNNRIPLLKLLHEEFIKKDYQIFISTYDRQWFELARNWFATNKIHYKSLEMFVESDDNPLIPDKPVIFPCDGLLAKAEAHFKAKDYPAAGNYLRKECENIIWNLLPDTYKIDVNGSNIQELEPLFQQVEKLYKDSNQPFPQELINSLKIYRKLILNPSSHNDNECPLFKKEIKDAFDLVNELGNIPKIVRKKILDKNDVLNINFPAQNYEMEITPSDNVFACELNGVKTISQIPLKFYIKKWIYEGTEFGELQDGIVAVMDLARIERCVEQKRELLEIFEGINRSVNIAIPADLEASVELDTAKTLKDLIS